MSTVINGNIIRYIMDGLFIVLIGTFGWVANKAETKVDQHETRIMAVEISGAEIKSDMKHVIRTLDEIKSDLKALRRSQ